MKFSQSCFCAKNIQKFYKTRFQKGCLIREKQLGLSPKKNICLRLPFTDKAKYATKFFRTKMFSDGPNKETKLACYVLWYSFSADLLTLERYIPPAPLYLDQWKAKMYGCRSLAILTDQK